MTNEKTPDFGTLDGLVLAIDVEKRGGIFYNEAAASTEDPRGRAMFTRLAQDEARHLDWLTRQKESLEQTGQWQETKLTGEALAAGQRVFPRAGGRRSAVKGKTRELEALRRGLQAEKDSVSLYTELAGKVDDPQSKATFLRLAEEEENHFRLLQAEHDYLSRSGFYFDMPEFSLEGLE